MKTNIMNATLLIRCKECGHESITHKNGEILKDDFISIKGKNIFENQTLCPICRCSEQEMDHEKHTCPCMYCSEDRRNLAELNASQEDTGPAPRFY